MGKTVHVYAHTHWDKEWYFTSSRSRVYLMKDLADVLDVLDNDPSFTAFLLDGQSGLIEDYLQWRPGDLERINNLVSHHRLMIGPWYTQTDQILISAESVVRNLYHGKSIAEQLGHCMNIGYVPDAFGQGGNMPQIYQSFGIKDVVMMRGVSDDMTRSTNYLWRGNDGSSVAATQLRTSYSIAMKIPTNPLEADAFWENICLKREGTPSATKHVLFPVGFDQSPIRRHLPEFIRARSKRDQNNTYILDSLEDYVAAVRKENPTLTEVHGQLLNGKLRRCHRSIYSSRSDLKVLNTRVQNYVVNVLEPLLTMSHMLGNAYPQGEVTEIWKLLFQNAAHDSIGSCVSDTVNEDVRMRYKQASNIAEALVELHSRLIATSVRAAKDSFTATLINTMPYNRNEVAITKMYLPDDHVQLLDHNGKPVKYTIIDKHDLTDYVLAQTINLDPSRQFYTPKRVFEATVAIEARNLPAFGYAQHRLALGRGSGEAPMQKLSCLENEYYRIEVNADGSLNITDKGSGTVYSRQLILVDNGDDGDSFNYSPPRNDMEIFSTSCFAQTTIEGSDLYQKATIDITMNLPADLEARAAGSANVPVAVRLTVALRQGSNVIDVDIHVDNCVKSHRMCALFDAQMAINVNYADEYFGSVKRPNRLPDMDDWERDEGMGWNEKPLAIQPTQSYVGLFSESRGIAVFPKGVREYQITNNDGLEGDGCNLIRLTLFRTYGHMGKADLLLRPGRASGEDIVETPDAQLIGAFDTSFGFGAFSSGIDEANLCKVARSYNTPIQVYEYASFLNGRLMFSEEEIDGAAHPANSLFTLEGDLTISAIKKAEREDAMIIRLYNGKTSDSAKGVLRFSQSVSSAKTVNLMEENLESLKCDDSAVTIPSLAPSKFTTIKVTFN